MKWENIRLMNVFIEPDSVMQNAMKRWWVRPFRAMKANEDISWNSDGDDRTDCNFRSMAAFVAFDTFIGFVAYVDRKYPLYGFFEPMPG